MSLFVLSRRSFSVLKQMKEKILPTPFKIDVNLQKKLEHLSLISFQNEQVIKKVEQTIQSSDIIHQVNVDHLQPLYTLVETELCPLKQTDTISNEKTLPTKQVLGNASTTYEDYLVAPMIGKRDSQTVEKIDKTEL
jgi:Asp-tRNA(Asn)/Glu-tRNA(Gln) amidotransferase C subunit